MDNCSESKRGQEMLVERYRMIFRVPENVNYYSEEDYRVAERKFLKLLLERGTPCLDEGR